MGDGSSTTVFEDFRFFADRFRGAVKLTGGQPGFFVSFHHFVSPLEPWQYKRLKFPHRYREMANIDDLDDVGIVQLGVSFTNPNTREINYV